MTERTKIILQKSSPEIKKQLIELQKQAKSINKTMYNKKHVKEKSPWDTLLIRHPEDINFDDFSNSPRTVAKWFELFDQHMLVAVQRREFFNRNWTRTDIMNTQSPNIVRMVNMFNLRSYWVSSSVLREKDENKVPKILTFFIQLGDECRRLRNFYAVFSITMGLCLGPVFRLSHLWRRLSDQSKSDFDNLKTMCHPFLNSQFYRNIYQQALGDCLVPNVAILLKDCFLLEEIPTFDRNRVNFNKYHMQYKQLRDFFQTQDIVRTVLGRNENKNKHVRKYISSRDRPNRRDRPKSRFGSLSEDFDHYKERISTGEDDEYLSFKKVRAALMFVLRDENLFDEDQLWNKSYDLRPRGANY